MYKHEAHCHILDRGRLCHRSSRLLEKGLACGRGGAPQPAVQELVGGPVNGVKTTSAVYEPRDLGEGSQGYKRWRSALSIPYPYGSHRGEDDGLVP